MIIMEIKTSKSELEKEFLQFLMGDVGKGQFAEDQFEEVEVGEGKEEEQEDFGFEEEEGDGPEASPYKKSIGLAPEKRTPINKAPPELYIHNYNFLYGCNHGSRTVAVVQGKLCVAVGVNVFFCGKVYFGHNYTITFVSYQAEHKLVITGTEGKCAEIMLWSVVEGEKGYVLEPYYQEGESRMLNLPLSCLAVGAACVVREGVLVVVTKFNLHKNSGLFVFDLKSRKRVHSQVKLDKVIEVVGSQPVVLLTGQGLVELTVGENLECEVKKVGLEMTITCVQLYESKSKCYLLGTLDGAIKMVERQSMKVSSSIQLHQKYVVCIRRVREEMHASVGGDKQLVLFKIGEDRVINKLQVLALQHTALNILPAFEEQSVFHCVMRTGQIVEVSLQEGGKARISDKGVDWDMAYQTVSRGDVNQHFIYNKYANKYFYGFSDSPQLSILSIDQSSKITAVKKVALKYEPFLLDVVGNIAAYIQTDSKFVSAASVLSSVMKSKEKQTQTKHLILEDYTCQKIYGQLQLLQESFCTKLKLSADGSKLALGFESGKVSVFDINKPSCITLLKESTVHESGVTDVIWSSDGKYLKTISKDNLVYLEGQGQGDQLKPVYTSKFLKDVEWTGVGKFDWRTNYVWEEHMHTPGDISNIKGSELYLLVCMEDGDLKIYRNPASKNSQKLARMFSGSFDCHIIKDSKTYFTAVFVSKGIIFALQISDEQPLDAPH